MKPTFYILNAKLSYQRGPVKIQPLVEYDSLSPLAENVILAKENQFRVDSGKKWYDIIQFADSFHFVIAKRVKEILEQNEISGWGSFPIRIEGQEDKQYFAFYVTSIAGKIQNLEAINNYETDAHQFDINTWNKTDFFTNEGTLNIICTERTKDLLVKEKVSNIEFENF